MSHRLSFKSKPGNRDRDTSDRDRERDEYGKRPSDDYRRTEQRPHSKYDKREDDYPPKRRRSRSRSRSRSPDRRRESYRREREPDTRREERSTKKENSTQSESRAPAKTAAPAPPMRTSLAMIEVIANDRLGGKVRVKCSPDDTVGDLKKLIAAQKGTKPEKIVLKKWYTIFKDHIKLSDYEIHNGMSLEMN